MTIINKHFFNEMLFIINIYYIIIFKIFIILYIKIFNIIT